MPLYIKGWIDIYNLSMSIKVCLDASLIFVHAYQILFLCLSNICPCLSEVV